jgi:hypothetical protein
VDLNKLLSLLAGLEEQVHQVYSGENLSHATRQILSQKDKSRFHTSLGRLTSLLSLPTTEQVPPISLAEHGVCNVLDRNLASGLRFYQHLQVEMENVFDRGQGQRGVQAALEDQFKSNLMVRGFESWNVPLHRSINVMPPKLQSSALSSCP